ncbi:MAG: hypothetical protein HYR88_11895 [Verrucomicrobia bacterium]|nr:hypothetical protein [Verrucomicrobiota bacterium]MBI3870358.1 hypothetical protein [Verrucomicrobiota bacterium]
MKASQFLVPRAALCALIASGSALALSLSAANFSVSVGPGLAFNPSSLTIQVGDTVTWSGLVSFHTVTSDSAPEVFCGTARAATCTKTFTTPGVFPYHCIPHESFGMKGTLTVKPAAGKPPTAQITNPVDGDVFPAPASVHIDATAGDTDGKVTQVEFFADAKSLGVDGTSPFGIDSSALSDGHYTLTARATDNSSLITTSAPVKITVVIAQAPLMSKVDLNGLGVFSFDYSTQMGLRYIVQLNSALSTDKWTSLETNKAVATVSHFSRLLTPGPLAMPPEGYYRVLVHP